MEEEKKELEMKPKDPVSGGYFLIAHSTAKKIRTLIYLGAVSLAIWLIFSGIGGYYMYTKVVPRLLGYFDDVHRQTIASEQLHQDLQKLLVGMGK